MQKTSFLREVSGQDLIEYTLLMAFVALASAAMFIGVGGDVKGIWETKTHALDIEVRGTGRGTILAFEVGSRSGPTPCMESNPCIGEGALKFKEGTEVMLIAVPEPGSDYVGWLGGACESEKIGCTFRMTADKKVVTGFERRP